MTDRPPVKRAIRSFVRRSGRMTPSQKNAFASHWQNYGIDYRNVELNLNAIAEGYSRIVLEIGIGNGDAIIDMAENDPQSFYIGIEVHEPGIGRCLNRIAAKSLPNVRLICHDAIEVMQSMLPPHSLDRILLFFPDPWHKKRHHKRRIVNQLFRDLCYQLLAKGGYVHLATDWQDYAEHMSQEFMGDARFRHSGNARGYVERPSYRPQTHFERRGLRLGHGVWDLLFIKAEPD